MFRRYLRCGVYGIFTEDIEHVQHSITFLTPLNHEYEDSVLVKKFDGISQAVLREVSRY